MRRFILLWFLAIACTASSCDDTTSPKETAPEAAQNTSDTLKIAELKGLKPNINLTKEAREAVTNWSFYTELSQAIDSLSGRTMGTLKPQVESLAEVFINKESAEEAEVPATPAIMETNAIQARIRAIETQVNTLRNHTNRQTPDLDQVAIAIVKVKNGLQNLNLQLNERFTISIKELLEEIQNDKSQTPNGTNNGPSGKPNL